MVMMSTATFAGPGSFSIWLPGLNKKINKKEANFMMRWKDLLQEDTQLIDIKGKVAELEKEYKSIAF